MVTDEMMTAIDFMIEMCVNEEQRKGMESIREMLADYDENLWMSADDPIKWLAGFMACDIRTTETAKRYSEIKNGGR